MRSRLEGSKLSKFIPPALGDRMVEGRVRNDQLPDTGELDPAFVKEHVLAEMERLGTQAILLVPNKLVQIGQLSVRDYAVAMCNAYIDYQLDKVADPAAGIYAMPIVTWHDPEAGAALIERVGRHPAVAAVCLITMHATPPWGDVVYNPIYEACERLGLPVVMHAASGTTLIERAGYQDGFQRLIEAHSLNFLVSNVIQLTSIVFQGLPVRFPKLKIVFLETGVFWVPMMMFRLDEYFLKRRSEAPLLEALPSEYILEHMWFGTQPLESPKDQRSLEAVFDAANGRERFMFASDRPHWDFDDPIVVERLTFLGREDKAKVFATNALGVFNFSKGGEQPWQRTVSELSARSGRRESSSSKSPAVP
jgi:predicted TIM-barrel fold metal-dependent hydrolase